MSSSSLKKKTKLDQQFDYLQKIIIIGDSGVGKSNILLRYSQGKFVQNYMMTIGINYTFKIVSIDGAKIKLQIWDTAGQDKYKTITQNYYRNSDGVLIVFSIDSRESFSSVRIWIEDLSQTITDSTQIMLVGNKNDLQSSREVSVEEAKEFAQQHQIPYIECSAKSGQSIEDVFMKLGRMMKENIIDKKVEGTEEVEKKMGEKLFGGEGKKLTERCCPSG